jgi:hypothetical protein
MSVGQVALATGQVLLIVFGSFINDYAVYVIASHVSRQQKEPEVEPDALAVNFRHGLQVWADFAWTFRAQMQCMSGKIEDVGMAAVSVHLFLLRGGFASVSAPPFATCS